MADEFPHTKSYDVTFVAHHTAHVETRGPAGFRQLPAADPAWDRGSVAGDGEEMAAGLQHGRTRMTRRHRRWHLWMWMVLAPLLAAGLIAALAARPAPAEETEEVVR